LVLTNDNQSVAAMPGFHTGPPRSGGTGLMFSFAAFLSEYRSELLERN
jgi:hypothetical protein